MNQTIVMTLSAALAAAVSVPAARADVVDIGTFVNVSNTSVSYSGDFAKFVSWQALAGGHVRIDVDLGGLLGSIGESALASVTVTDSGLNQYGPLSSGADIDLFTLEGVDGAVTYDYAGPNVTHQNETPAQLAERVLAIDAQSGIHEVHGSLHLSLALEGSLTAVFAEPQDGAGVWLHLAEAGASESFQVTIETARPVDPPDRSCPADVNGDGTVNVGDLVEVITSWQGNSFVKADVNGDGAVNVADLIEVIIAWGDCP